MTNSTSTPIATKELIKEGLWSNNPALVQLLGLCPLLAVSNTAISALTLGLATTLVLIISNVLIALFRNHIDYNFRIPYFMLIIASIVTCIILILQAKSYELYQSLGVYLALITTNCVILGRIEAFAYKNTVFKSFIDGLANGIGFSVILLILGSFRELIGQGTIFSNAHLLFGDIGHDFQLNFHSFFDGKFILALLPPGAFFSLGLLIAFKNSFTNIQSTCNHNNTTNNNEQKTNISNIPTLSPKKS